MNPEPATMVRYAVVRNYLERRGYVLLRNWPPPVRVFVKGGRTPITFAVRDKLVRASVYAAIRNQVENEN